MSLIYPIMHKGLQVPDGAQWYADHKSLQPHFGSNVIGKNFIYKVNAIEPRWEEYPKDTADEYKQYITPMWSGEGFPPARAELEYQNSRERWSDCVVIGEGQTADGSECVVIQVEYDSLFYICESDLGSLRQRNPKARFIEEGVRILKKEDSYTEALEVIWDNLHKED